MQRLLKIDISLKKIQNHPIKIKLSLHQSVGTYYIRPFFKKIIPPLHSSSTHASYNRIQVMRQILDTKSSRKIRAEGQKEP